MGHGRGAITPEEGNLVFVERDPQAGPGGNGQFEIGISERLGENFLGQQQRAEQLGAPGKLGERGKEMRRGDRPDPPSSMVPP